MSGEQHRQAGPIGHWGDAGELIVDLAVYAVPSYLEAIVASEGQVGQAVDPRPNLLGVAPGRVQAGGLPLGGMVSPGAFLIWPEGA